MRRLFISSLLVTLMILAGPAAFGQSAVSAEGLRVEYLVDPLGIDVLQPRLSWLLASGQRGQKQSAYQIVVASSLANLQKDVGDLWDSKKVNSGEIAQVTYAGRPLTTGLQCYWKVRAWDAQGRPSPWSKPAMWSMGLLHDSDWYGRFIGAERPADVAQGTPLPFPWLRKTVTLKQKPRRATAYVNTLGYYELYINGKKVDDHVLSPAVSDYSKRTYYVTFDVTNYLTEGANCVALWLGRGWYVRGHPGVIHDGPLVRAQIDVNLPDGSSQKVGTDATWKVRFSPITPLGKGTAFGDYGGEHYDARLELNNWNATKLDDSDWKPAGVFSPPPAITSAQMVEPNRIMQTLNPVSVAENPPGSYLIDMGRNYVGWFELQLPPGATAGKSIRLEYADIPPTGNRFMTANQRDEYVTRAGAGQVFRSRFNYHGFQYVHITGLERKPSLADLKGYFIRTAYQRAGEFQSSNEFLNRLYRTVTWTYECLTLGGYVVDCPTRERLGYGGDAGSSMETGMFNFDMPALYTKWSANWRDTQDPKTGDIPYTAPAYPEQGGGGPTFSGFVIGMPWQVYLQYGDKRILEASYPTMQKYLSFLDTKAVDNILEPYVSYGIKNPQWNYLGDWQAPRREPDTGGPRDPIPARFFNTCFYLYDLQLTARIADILGKKDDAAKYAQKASTIKKVLHERFFNPGERTYTTGQQPYLAFPLLLKVVPDDLRSAVLKNLEDAIVVKNKGHLDSGFFGTYFMLRLLMQEDRNDLIYEMASQKTFPSWGQMLEQGATTIWESWNGGSHIHDTLIAIGTWFTEGIGGIRWDEQSPGFKHFFISPGVVGDLKSARTTYKSMHGLIVSDWRIDNGSLHLDVTVPPGTTATVLIPSSTPAAVTESGRPVAASNYTNGRAVFLVESGRYAFVSKLGPR